MPYYYDYGKDEEIKPLSKEGREALLSGDPKAWHDYTLKSSPEYRDAFVSKERERLQSEIRRLERTVDNHYPRTQSHLTEYNNDKDMMIE